LAQDFLGRLSVLCFQLSQKPLMVQGFQLDLEVRLVQASLGPQQALVIHPVQCLPLVQHHLANLELLADQQDLRNPFVPVVLVDLETQLDLEDQVVQ